LRNHSLQTQGLPRERFSPLAGLCLSRPIAFASMSPMDRLSKATLQAAVAANTPIASTVMAIELFGPQIGVYAALACVVSYLFSGHTGIYRAQRVGHAKHPLIPVGMRLADIPAWRRARRKAATVSAQS
jgi:hypothetical protein